MAINYVKTAWVNGQAPALNAQNMNKIESGIKDSCDGVDEITAEIETYGDIVTRNLTASTTDITAGTTPLATGDLYVVYEE